MIPTIGRVIRFLTPQARGNRGSYRKLLVWTGCITVCIPVLLASTIYYQISKHQLEQQIFSESQAALTSVKDQVELFLQVIEQSSHDLAMNPIMKQKNLSGGQSENPFEEHLEILSDINIKKNSNGLVSEVYYYNQDEPDIVLSNYYGAMPIRLFPMRSEIEWHMAGSERTRWYNTNTPDSSNKGLISFVRKLPLNGSGMGLGQGLLVFHMEAAAINRYLFRDTSTKGQRQEFIMIDEQNQLHLFSYGQKEVFGNQIRSQTVDYISSSGQSKGNIVAPGLDGRPASISYTKNAFGRIYISIIPEEMITERLTWIRISTILVLLFVIAIGLMLTYFSSKRIYSPIEQLLKYGNRFNSELISKKDNEFEFIRECFDHLSRETEKFTQYIDKIEPTLRERCLQQLLEGEYLRNESLMSDCRIYGIQIQAMHVMIVVELQNLEHETRFMLKDKPVLTYAITNVMQELLDTHKHITGYVVSLHGHVAALLQFPQDFMHPKMLELTVQFARTVHETLEQVLKLNVSVGIGRFYTHIADMSVSYREAESALLFRVFNEMEPVLFIEELENNWKQTHHRYPKDLENAIVDSLIKGELQEAEQALHKFSEVLRTTHSYNSVYQSYFLLLSAVISSLEEQGGNILELLESNWFNQLKSKQTSRDICEWFTDVMFPMYRWMSENHRNAFGKNAIGQVSHYIKENCSSDVSLVQCAEFIGLSPSYLSRLFKKETGINFLEYVIECKMEEVKRLLLDTGLNVGDVAAAIGYSERNMKRHFQKHVGMSPSMFRANHR
ncbi:helix-turn-helix domain-containing protein [Paenibacillus agricola]|uniref:Helix-turn-helix transcriptional regulator n=1 Tax=Paenibacillus agricola TaxID=2716264 RepID=A0ABX0JBD5_9BACL|nr:helix-turn-helix domain-containing protein [Paenibacillus agricola]NHN31479.1 helix-turn-helix transcriptional regulator [Paenibacillus agricola]